MSPAIVPIPFDSPIKILAYLGAMSRWLTLYPEIANPLQATPIVNAVIAPACKREEERRKMVNNYLWTTRYSFTIPYVPLLKTAP